jgi:methionyl-tRNA formyltransferase
MLSQWVESHTTVHDIKLARSKAELQGGDLLFLISFGEIINAEDREKFKKVLVIHASDLPQGRGWSPHIWDIVNGANEITVSLLEAQDKVDSGDIWQKVRITIPQHFLYDEINERLFAAESQLMDFAVENFHTITPYPQNLSVEPSYHQRRTSADSELDPGKSIASQFNLLRVSDPERFPAFFKLYGHTYKVTVEKVDNE